jgi:hypothetical protein
LCGKFRTTNRRSGFSQHRLSRLLRRTKINQYQTTITAPLNDIGWFDIAMNNWW